MVNRTFGGGYSGPMFKNDQMIWHKVSHDQVTPEDLVVYTNNELEESLKHTVRKRVAWLLESRGIAWPSYHFIEDNFEAFDVIFTCNDSIVDLDPNRCIYIPRGGCWIRAEDHRIYEKTRLVSFMSSGKGFEGWSAIGHRLRPDLYHILTQMGGDLGTRLERAGIKQQIGIYGKITGNNMPYKLPALKDYMFHITVENMIDHTYFTEKLIDCFVTGTVPIFRGSHKIDRFFNPDGIIFFDGLEELTDILADLTDDDYHQRRQAIAENFERVREFLLPEDWMCRHTGLLDW
jgi:hypothetical protein